MNAKIIGSLVVLILLLLVLSGSAFVINEAEQVLITRFGEPVGQPITEPGIHFKVPFVETVNRFDKRFLEWNGDPNEVPTKEKTYIYVDTYARWRIVDPLLFFQKVQNEMRAQSRLDDILDGAARIAISKYDLVELVRSSNRDFIADEDKENSADRQRLKINIGRAKIVNEIIVSSESKAKELGIEILDFRFKRIKYAESVQRKIYDRMRTERQKIADKFRSEGQGEYENILGKKNNELKTIQSEAYKEAEIINGKADAEATRIYAEAYNRSAETRDFYRFIQTMETYKKTMTEKDMLVLSTKSDFFKYLQSQN